jgi:hypothetical protein
MDEAELLPLFQKERKITEKCFNIAEDDFAATCSEEFNVSVQVS